VAQPEVEQFEAIVAMLAEQILSYLDAHPRAADSRKGIERWWLGSGTGLASPDAVQQALDELVARGHLWRRELIGGEVIYSLAEPRNEQDE
jgi:hypothetical protein